MSALQQLEPQLLGALIRHVGIEDSGHLLALVSTDQLCALADDELWRASDGTAEVFDAEQFAVWLEVLADAGPGVAAEALAAFDEDLLTHALAQHMMVLDLDQPR